MNKVSIIGAGAVGATTAYLLSHTEWIDEVVLVDLDKNRAIGQALDMMHGVGVSTSRKVTAGGYAETKDSDIVVITIGVPEKVGESRLVPMQKNADILKDIVPQIVNYSPKTKIITVSNPVDILAYMTYQVATIPAANVIGLGTLLDTSRLKYILSDYFNISPQSITASVIGEHGDAQVVLWSQTRIGGLSVQDFAQSQGMTLPHDFTDVIAQRVKETAFDVWQMKGPNCFCVADAIKCLIDALCHSERRILPVSHLYQTQTGKEVYISLPSIVSRQGVEQRLPQLLNEKEHAQLYASCDVMRSYIDQLK
ncbi:lactate/malate family dehydrogenase [Staphylococcus coagulans]|uniref:lactate/malate family dehydrogenase n=1 Tax=Staphylococcus coagulans TaxID=74706 RepID=UPI001F4C2EDC|nr:lactate dehydrogenase [Staphylococcus coagulans]UNB46336.1 lactate dehydrogenase [Staphylococcus coagulans]